MNTGRRYLALMLIKWCAILLPVDRAPWAAAMKAEVSAIEDENAALSFAIGCLWGSVKDRVFNMAFAAQAVRSAAIGGMLAFAFLSAKITTQMIGANLISALVFGLTSLLFAATAVWSHLRGPMALVRAASSFIPCYFIAYILVLPEQGISRVSGISQLFQAIAIEGVFIWATLLAGGLFMLRIEASTTDRHLSSIDEK